MIEFRTKINQIMIGIWLNGDKGNVVLAPGMPQYLDKYHPFVEQMKRLEYNLFVPRYMGTYESDGEFSTMNSVKSLEATVKLAKKGTTEELYANKTLKWNNEKVYLIGFSYGSLPSLLQGEGVNKTILVCPFAMIKYHLENSEGEDIKKTFEFLERAYTNIYRLNANDVVEDLKRIDPPKHKENLVMVFGESDTSIPKEEKGDLQAICKTAPCYEKESGHSLKMTDNMLKEIISSK